MSTRVEVDVTEVQVNIVRKTTGIGQAEVTRSGLVLVTPECEIEIMGDSVAMRALLDRMASAVANPRFSDTLWNRGFGDG